MYSFFLNYSRSSVGIEMNLFAVGGGGGEGFKTLPISHNGWIPLSINTTI